MKKIFMLAIIALLLQSCCTILSGTKQAVTFNSDPPDATVYIAKIQRHPKSDPYRAAPSF